jgi:hypothetical protein
VKGLAVRFFAALRMTILKGYVEECTKVVHSGLALLLIPRSTFIIYFSPALRSAAICRSNIAGSL